MEKKYFSGLQALDSFIEATKVPNKEIFNIDKRSVEEILADIKLDGYTLINFVGKINKRWIEMVDNVIITEKEIDFYTEEGFKIKIVDEVKRSESAPPELKPHPESKILAQINSAFM